MSFVRNCSRRPGVGCPRLCGGASKMELLKKYEGMSDLRSGLQALLEKLRREAERMAKSSWAMLVISRLLWSVWSQPSGET